LFVSSPHDAAWTPEALASNNQNNIQRNTEMIGEFQTCSEWRPVANDTTDSAATAPKQYLAHP
jgi:hypothetical protein